MGDRGCLDRVKSPVRILKLMNVSDKRLKKARGYQMARKKSYSVMFWTALES